MFMLLEAADSCNADAGLDGVVQAYEEWLV